MLVLRMSASPIPATMIPPGPGITPTSGDTTSRTTPSAKIDHSTIGLSRNFAHLSRRFMRVDVVIHRQSRKTLAGKVPTRLASLRRARGIVHFLVIPAKAGIPLLSNPAPEGSGTPAFAGVTAAGPF